MCEISGVTDLEVEDHSADEHKEPPIVLYSWQQFMNLGKCGCGVGAPVCAASTRLGAPLTHRTNTRRVAAA